MRFVQQKEKKSSSYQCPFITPNSEIGLLFWCWIRPTAHGSLMYCSIDSFSGFDIVDLLKKRNQELILSYNHIISAVEVIGLYSSGTSSGGWDNHREWLSRQL